MCRTVDIGECLEEAALREMKEEIGLDLYIKDLKVLKEIEVTRKETNLHITKYYYVICNIKEKNLQFKKMSYLKLDGLI